MLTCTFIAVSSVTVERGDLAAPLVGGVVGGALGAAVVEVDVVGQHAVPQRQVEEQAVRALEQRRLRALALVVPRAVRLVRVRVVRETQAVVLCASNHAHSATTHSYNFNYQRYLDVVPSTLFLTQYYFQHNQYVFQQDLYKLKQEKLLFRFQKYADILANV